MSFEESRMEEELERGDDESVSSGSTSPEGMSDDESVDVEKITTLEDQIRSNPFSYDPHVELITLLRKTGDLDKLRKARDEMSKLFPLTADLWLDWLTDEAKFAVTDVEKEYVTALFERAVHDYMSVNIWLEYVQFLMLNMKLNEEYEKIRTVFERALTAVGIHVTHGSLIWHAYREFEKIILCSLQASSEKNSQTEEQLEQQRNRIFNLFKRQLSVPLFEMERTYEECIESFRDKMDRSLEEIYQKAKRKLDQLRPYEDALLESEAPHLEEYKQYIEYEKKIGDPIRIQNIYERALVENCLMADLWQQYCKYLDTQVKIEEFLIPVHERAVRNCPWSVQLWLNYLKALERHSKPHNIVKDAFERAVQVAFTTAEDYKQLWITYLDYLRRRIKWDEDHETELKVLRNTFQAANDHLMNYFRDSDAHCAIMKYWAKIEAKYCDNMPRARELWNDIISSGHSAEAQEWLQYAYFEKLHGDVKHYRKVLFKALYAANDWPEMIGDELITFEREEGTLETLDVATEKYEIQFQRIQERRIKAAEKENEREKQGMEMKKQVRAAKRAEKAAKLASMKLLHPKSSTQDHSSDEDIHMDSEGFKIPPPRSPRVQCPGQGRDQVGGSSSPVKQKREEDDDDDEFLPERKRKKVEENPPSHGTAFKHDPEKDNRTVFLSNLAYTLDEDTIKAKFSDAGEIVEVRLVKDYCGRSKGYCYVVFATQEQASEALKKDRETIEGRPMYVSPCEDRKRVSSKPVFKFGTGLEKNKLFVKNLPFSTTKEELEEIFKEFGDLKEVRIVTYRNGHSKGLAYVEFENETSATSALLKTDGSKVGNNIITVAISNPPAKKPRSDSRGVKVSDFLGGGAINLGPRGKGHTQVSLLPRALQRSQVQPKPSSSREHKSVQNGSGDEASSSKETKKLSNDDFRNLLLRK